ARARARSRPAAALALVLAPAASLAACGGKDASATDPSQVDVPAADVPELEIRSSGVDRFTTCPPPGDLGQHWIPPLPAWTPPPRAADARALAPPDPSLIARSAERTTTELAVEATYRDFRSCYRRGLV